MLGLGRKAPEPVVWSPGPPARPAFDDVATAFDERPAPQSYGQRRFQPLQPDRKPPVVTTDRPVSILVRNGTSLDVMNEMQRELGVVASMNRYFVPKVQNMDTIVGWGVNKGFFVKTSNLGSLVVIDVCKDKRSRE